MSDLDSGFTTAAGISAVDVAEIVREEFCRILGIEMKENLGAMERWLDATEFLVDMCAKREEHRWAVLSDRVAGIVCPQTDWDSERPVLKAAWQAATRHAVNCIMAEDRAEFDTAREHDWREWVLRHAAEKGNDGKRLQDAES